MGYIEQNLMPGETITYRAKLHWAIFLRPVILIIIGLLALTADTAIGAILTIGGIIFLVPVAISFASSEFAITSKRVMMKTGLIRRNSLELLLERLEGVSVDQGILARILNYGTIVVTGTGGLRTPFKNIAEPMEFRQRVYAHISTD